MCRRMPGEEADDAGLEDEDDADSGIEAAEVVGHDRDAERWASNRHIGPGISWGGGEIFVVVCWDHLAKEAA